MRAFGTAKQGLSGALGRLLAVSETYPDLKANSILMQLSEKPAPRTKSHSPARHLTTL
jgi:LemA protein